jgi:hypothetical protein
MQSSNLPIKMTVNAEHLEKLGEEYGWNRSLRRMSPEARVLGLFQ